MLRSITVVLRRTAVLSIPAASAVAMVLSTAAVSRTCASTKWNDHLLMMSQLLPPVFSSSGLNADQNVRVAVLLLNVTQGALVNL